MREKSLCLFVMLQLLSATATPEAQVSATPTASAVGSTTVGATTNSAVRPPAIPTPAHINAPPSPATLAEPIPDTAGGRLLALLGRTRIVTPGERELANTRDKSELADPLNWAVTIYKSRHQLLVYYKGRIFKTYHAVFGRFPDPGPKLYEGDLRTPEGVYAIVGKYYNRRWKHFLKLNYPNAVDYRHYIQAVNEGVIPDIHGRLAPLGGAIGIHGTDVPWLNRMDVNWTTGCISVDNNDIIELDMLLPLKTLVVIKH
jgi:hypothetical protein